MIPEKSTSSIEFFGNFITNVPPEQDSLEITFSPSSFPIKQRWRNNRLSAYFVADYFTNFLPSNDQDETEVERIKNSKGAVSYVSNELLENALKYHYEDSQHKIRFGVQFLQENNEVTAVIFATNCIKPGSEQKLRLFIEELLNSDPQDFYVQQLEKSMEEEDSGSSGLGIITMINDYEAKIGWKLETITDSNINDSSSVIVTTMVQIQV